MSKLEIIHLGHPALRAKSKTVTKKELKSKAFQQFLDDLCAICDANNGAGIAAPQVGINKRVIIIHVDPKNPRYPGKKPFPLTAIINPKVVKKSKALEEGWEGDLSASLRAKVSRPVNCVVEGLDRRGNPVRYELDYGFHARVFQHEIDHLSGIMMIDRVKRKETICELPEWEKYWKDKAVEPVKR
jgi:peptide deformylase